MMNPTAPDRQNWMSVLAKAPPARLADLFPDLPPHDLVRAPECGAVMVQGRIGGTGAAFNLGEMTVTRCSVTLADGRVGHALVQGRDKAHAQRAAVLDALLQADNPHLHDQIIQTLATEAALVKAQRAAKAAATKVEFFTMVRGDD